MSWKSYCPEGPIASQNHSTRYSHLCPPSSSAPSSCHSAPGALQFSGGSNSSTVIHSDNSVKVRFHYKWGEAIQYWWQQKPSKQIWMHRAAAWTAPWGSNKILCHWRMSYNHCTMQKESCRCIFYVADFCSHCCHFCMTAAQLIWTCSLTLTLTWVDKVLPPSLPPPPFNISELKRKLKYTDTHAHTCKHTHTHIRTHVHSHTHTHTHVHVHTNTFSQPETWLRWWWRVSVRNCEHCLRRRRRNFFPFFKLKSNSVHFPRLEMGSFRR